MASFINDFEYTTSNGATYIYRGYVYSDVLSNITVLNTNYLPVPDEEQARYKLTPIESKEIYEGIMSIKK